MEDESISENNIRYDFYGIPPLLSSLLPCEVKSKEENKED